MRLGSLCSGYGGLEMGLAMVEDVELMWQSEVDPGASKVLEVRHPDVPNLGDLTAVDWTAVEPVDLVCFGFPCQDLSYAGRGAGIKEGTRSGLWYACWRAVRILRPRIVFVENVAALVTRRPGLDVVLADIAADGYDARWTCLRASDVGAPHARQRIFLIATDADGASRQARGEHRRQGPWVLRRPQPLDGGDALAADPNDSGLERRPAMRGGEGEQPARSSGVAVEWGVYEPAIRRWESLTRPAPSPVDGRGQLSPPFVEWMMGLPRGWVTLNWGGHLEIKRTAQLHCLGNGVVPQQAAAAWRILNQTKAVAA